MTHEVLWIIPVSKYWFESLNFAMNVLTIGIQSKTYVEIGLFGICRVKSSLKTLLDVGHQKNDASVWLFSWIIFVSRNESRPFLLCCLLFPLYCLLRQFLNFSRGSLIEITKLYHQQTYKQSVWNNFESFSIKCFQNNT